MNVILCSPIPASIIKAVLLSQIHNDLPCLKGEQESLGLFMFTAANDADQTSLSPLLHELQETCGLNADWLTDPPARTLISYIAANLRYSSFDRSAVIFAAVEQALRYGHAYCLCGVGNISQVFITRARAVSHEVHRMTGFIRFHPAPDNTLVAQPRLFHQTADIILKKFAGRYPNNRLVLVLPEQALVMENGCLTSAPVDTYLPHVQNDDFAKMWETYYQSQYIATRKNIKLASRVIPKKYWEWLAEGKILEQES